MYHAHPYGRHGHVHHGANLGVRADMYWDVGGFCDLEEDEDVDLVRRLSEAGACIAWERTLRSPRLRVSTAELRAALPDISVTWVVRTRR